MKISSNYVFCETILADIQIYIYYKLHEDQKFQQDIYFCALYLDIIVIYLHAFLQTTDIYCTLSKLFIDLHKLGGTLISKNFILPFKWFT